MVQEAMLLLRDGSLKPWDWMRSLLRKHREESQGQNFMGHPHLRASGGYGPRNERDRKEASHRSTLSWKLREERRVAARRGWLTALDTTKDTDTKKTTHCVS